MSSRYGILSAVLLFLMAVLAYGNYRMWFPGSEIPAAKDTRKKDAIPPPLPFAAAPREIPPRESYQAIAEKNPFNPDRREFTVAADGTPGVAKPIARPTITLYGVVLGDQYQSASIVNPGRPLHKGERETKTLKIGDQVGDYKLGKILHDRIVMEAGEDSFEVLLFDPRTPKRRVDARTPVQATTVTSSAQTPGAVTAGPPGGPPITIAPAPTAVAPVQPGIPPASSLPRPAASLPMAPAGQPETAYQPAPLQPMSPAPQGAPEVPGVWRGRRPGLPASPGATAP
ncbi:MAG TPA: hypothetical protein VLS90_11455 [Thermodesulfobacteriota bacterium]|nr:hypothetical protein [Thermodesulfobacteriota bacterium]